MIEISRVTLQAVALVLSWMCLHVNIRRKTFSTNKQSAANVYNDVCS